MADPNVHSPSTTWEWRRVKIRRPAGGHRDSAPKAHRWRRFARRDPGEWITLRVKYTGGSEAWVLIEGRGERNAYPGWTALCDLVFDVNQCR